jgi:hypothetical protein
MIEIDIKPMEVYFYQVYPFKRIPFIPQFEALLELELRII